MRPRSNRVVFFARNELRRILINELREAKAPFSARDMAEKIIGLEGKGVRDRRLRNDMGSNCYGSRGWPSGRADIASLLGG